MPGPSKSWWNSIITRLILCVIVCSIVLSLGLGWLQYRRWENQTHASITSELTMAGMQAVDLLSIALAQPEQTPAQRIMETLQRDDRFAAVRLIRSDGSLQTVGTWSVNTDQIPVWTLHGNRMDADQKVDLHRPLLIMAPVRVDDETHHLQMIANAPVMRSRIKQQIVDHLLQQALIFALICLIGLIGLRRWLIQPIRRVLGLIREQASARDFADASLQTPTEISELSSGIATMLDKLDLAHDQLRKQTEAMTELYQQAPAPMLDLDDQARVIRMNGRARHLLGYHEQDDVTHKPLQQHIHHADHAKLDHALALAHQQTISVCEVRLAADMVSGDIVIEFTAQQTEAGKIILRASMTDITEPRRLMRRLREQRRLMNLMVQHIDDALMLVAEDRRIVNANRACHKLLGADPASLIDQPFDPANLFNAMDLSDPQSLEYEINHWMTNPTNSFDMQIEATDATYRLLVACVEDHEQGHNAYLWLIRDITAQVRHERWLTEQAAHLAAVQEISERLHHAVSSDAMLETVVAQMRHWMSVDALGIAIRQTDGRSRCRQIIDLDETQPDRVIGEQLAEHISTNMLREVLRSGEPLQWSAGDTHEQHEPWRAAGYPVGLAMPLIYNDQRLGIIWVAQQQGRGIAQRIKHLMQAMVPVIGSAMSHVELRDRLRMLRLTDSVTGLGTARQLPLIIQPLLRKPGHQWAMYLIDLDRFQLVTTQVGHHEAERLLKRVAHQLRRCCRSGDHVLRVGHDRFVAVCEYLPETGAMNLADRLLASVRQAADDRADLTTYASIGWSSSTADAEQLGESADLWRLLEQRLRQAKATGRDRHVGPHAKPQRQAG